MKIASTELPSLPAAQACQGREELARHRPRDHPGPSLLELGNRCWMVRGCPDCLSGSTKLVQPFMQGCECPGWPWLLHILGPSLQIAIRKTHMEHSVRPLCPNQSILNFFTESFWELGAWPVNNRKHTRWSKRQGLLNCPYAMFVCEVCQPRHRIMLYLKPIY